MKTLAFYSNTNVLGGSEVYLQRLFEHLKKAPAIANRIYFFCSDNHPLRAEVEALGFDVVTAVEDRCTLQSSQISVQPTHNSRQSLFPKNFFSILNQQVRLGMGTIKETLRLRSLFQHYAIDMIHFNDTGCEAPVIAARLAGISQVVGTFHVVPSEANRHKSWVHRLIEYFSVRSLHRAISVSEATKQAWLKRVHLACGDHIEVIYNGIHIDDPKFRLPKYSDRCRQDLGLAMDDFVILVPARLHPMKGHRFLFEALPNIIKKTQQSVRLLCVGDGPLHEELLQQVKSLQLEKVVQFLGFRSDVPALLHCADLVVLPSVALEALPFALIEAHACQKAIVASRFSGIPEIVAEGQTGFLVEPGNPNELTDAILKMIANPKKRQLMGVAGYKRAQHLFTLEGMLNNTYQFLNVSQ